jgi:Zn-dependent peptidase ImmA (M78 family)
MGEDDSRGLSLFFNRFPAIVIDQAEKHYGARNFTLFHEFCHLLVRQTGISDFNPRNGVERFCNRFAASFLMPPEAVRAVFELPLRGRIEPSVTRLDYSAKKLCVTISQMALRLEELEIAPSVYYNRIAESLRKPAAERVGGGGEWRYAYISRIGHNLPTLVLASLSRGNINSVEASRIMETSPDNIPAVKRTLEERRGGEVS